VTKTVALFGATSEIAKQTARSLIEESNEPVELFLVGRDAERLETLAADLKCRGAQRANFQAVKDLTCPETQAKVLQDMQNAISCPDIALLCYGSLPDQERVKYDSELLAHEMAVNTTGQIGMLAGLASMFILNNKGHIAAVTSVAGMRGRKSNFAYGAMKSAVSRYLQGMRLDLEPQGIAVLDIKPGLVRTPMTDGMDQSSVLWSDSDLVGRAIARKLLSGAGGVLYVPSYWRLIMYIVLALPNTIMKRLDI